MSLRWVSAAALLALCAPPLVAQLTIVTDTVPDAIIGQPYPAVNIETSGAVGPVTWSFVNIPFPPSGFVIGRSGENNTAGTFCYGASTNGGSPPVCTGNVAGFGDIYNFRLRAEDGVSSVERQFTIALQNQLRITTQELPDVPAGDPFSEQLFAAGGLGPFQWSVIDGGLPPGITLAESTGILSGTAPSIGASYVFRIRVLDTNTDLTATRYFVINVLGDLRIATAALPLTVLNQAMTPFQLQATGGSNYGWSVPAGWSLPPGFTLSVTGVLSGAPTVAGSYRFVIQVNSATQTEPVAKYFTLHVTLGALGIVETDLPVAAIGVPYQVTLTPSGGLPPYRWAFDTAATQGMQINFETGTIAGTPSSVGGFPLPVAITDATGTRVVKAFTLVVPGPLGISTTALPNAIRGTAYMQALTATGGQPPYTWSVIGDLPPGLDLVASRIEGVPTTEGLFPFEIRVRDFALNTVTLPISITVLPPVQTITVVTSALADGVVGVAYSQTLQAANAQGPVTWTLIGGALPANLGLNAATGEISGTPTAAGTANFTVRAADQLSVPGERVLSITVFPPLAISTSSLPNGRRGDPYSQTLAASGGKPPYTWSIASGVLPPSLTLDQAAGRIAGNPSAEGVFTFDLRVTDSGSNTVTRQISITVLPPVPTITVVTSALADGITGFAYSQTLQAANAQGPVMWSVIGGELPSGLDLNTATGEISGTPNVTGTANFTVRAADDQMSVPGERALSITVYPPLAISTASLPNAQRGDSYSQTLVASGGKPPYTWSLFSGSLPAGLTLNAAGVISGTATAAGTPNFQVNVSDSGPQSAQASLSITISESLTITTGDLTGTFGVAFSQTLAAAGGVPPYTWEITAGALPGGLVLNAATGAITGTPAAAGSFNVTFRVTDQPAMTASKQIAIVISTGPLPSVGFTSLPDSSPAARQPSVSVNLASAFPADVTGTLTLTFASSVGGDDQTVQFSTGARTLNFTIPAGATQAAFAGGTPAVLTGTVAGTITIAAQFSSGGQNVTPSPAPAKTIAVELAPPVISTVTLQRSGSTLTVVVNGYATSREMVSGTYRFAATAGTLSQTDIPVSLSSAFTAWFSSPASNPTGGQFRLTVPFAIQGDATAVNLVSVTLTNARGTSSAVGP